MRSITKIPFSIDFKYDSVSKTPKILTNLLSKKYNFNNIYDININNNYSYTNNRIYNIFKNFENIYYMNFMSLKRNKFNLNIGGDNSISIGSIAASNEIYKKNLKIIWIDSCPNINYIKTDVCENIKDMGVYYSMFYDSYNFGSWLNDNQIEPSQIIYIGIKDIKKEDYEILKKYNIKYYENPKINEIDNIIDEIYGKKIHITLDISSFDKSFFPCCRVYNNNGLDPYNIEYLFKNIKEQIINMDLVEINLDIENENAKEVTLYNIEKILKPLLL